MTDYSEIIRSFYRWGSGGTVNLFYRPQGTLVERACLDRPDYYNDRDEYYSSRNMYIIQWKGSPTFDSGYAAYDYEKWEVAIASFEAMAEEEFNNNCKVD